MTHYSFTQLEDLWVSVGGNPIAKAMAAAIAMAESGGNSAAVNNNGNGSVDRGLWQINSSHGSSSTFDPVANARAAVSISNNGSNWRPWCTAYSDALCGTKGGSYLGSGAPFLKFLNGSPSIPNSSGTPGAGNPVTAGASQNAAWYDWPIPLPGGGEVPLGGFSNTIESGLAAAISDVLQPIGRAILHGLFVIGGAALMLFGVYAMGKGSVNAVEKSPNEPVVNPPAAPPERQGGLTGDQDAIVRETNERNRQNRARTKEFESTQRNVPKRAGRTEAAAKSAAEKGAVA